MKEIKVSFSISLSLDRCDVNYLEDELLRKREEVFKELALTILGIIEEEILKRKVRCPKCGGEANQKGQNSRKIETLLGEIEFKRKRFKCKGCSREIYPLDEAIGLEPQSKCTLGVVERALWAAVEVSYEKTSEFLKKFTGLEVSRGHIHRLAIKEGRILEEIEERERERVFEEGYEVKVDKQKEVVYVLVDSTGVNDRDSGEWMEAKVGVVFSERALVSKNRVEILDKRSYGSFEGVEGFSEKFYLECMKAGVLEAKKVVFVGDGVGWIKNLALSQFPGCVYLLDLWHLKRNLKKVFSEEETDRLIDIAIKGDSSGLIRELMKKVAAERDKDVREKIEGLMTYVRNNEEGIRNYSLRDIWGSGPVEKATDIVICRRFKRRGMSWYRNKANPLLKLRLLKLNGEWDRYWAKRKDICAMFLAA